MIWALTEPPVSVLYPLAICIYVDFFLHSVVDSSSVILVKVKAHHRIRSTELLCALPLKNEEIFDKLVKSSTKSILLLLMFLIFSLMQSLDEHSSPHEFLLTNTDVSIVLTISSVGGFTLKITISLPD